MQATEAIAVPQLLARMDEATGALRTAQDVPPAVVRLVEGLADELHAGQLRPYCSPHR